MHWVSPLRNMTVGFDSSDSMSLQAPKLRLTSLLLYRCLCLVLGSLRSRIEGSFTGHHPLRLEDGGGPQLDSADGTGPQLCSPDNGAPQLGSVGGAGPQFGSGADTGPKCLNAAGPHE